MPQITRLRMKLRNQSKKRLRAAEGKKIAEWGGEVFSQPKEYTGKKQ